MPTIAILTQKGGAGKTTISTCIARQLFLDGENVVLVDTDPQGSARDWRSSTEQDTVQVIGLDRATIDKDIKAIKGDWIIIDGSPRNEPLLVSTLKIVDMVLIPVLPSPYDVLALGDFVELIKTRQSLTDGKPKAAFIISQDLERWNLSKQVRDILIEYGLPIFESHTTQRVIYRTSASLGLSPMDIEPNGKAAQEVRAILNEIKATL